MLPSISQLCISSFNGFNSHSNDICTLELTVATGLEEIAALECREKLNLSPSLFRGRVVVDIPIKFITEIFKIRSIDNVNVILKAEKISFVESREDCFKKLYSFANRPEWRKGIEIWKCTFGEEIDIECIFKDEKVVSETSFIAPKPELDLKRMKKDSSISDNLPQEVQDVLAKVNENISNIEKENLDSDVKIKEDNVEKEHENAGPKFRVTCHRVGSNHTFGSSEAARQFGGGINEKFGWPVNLSHYKLEILLNIIEEFVYVAISLTREPLFKRNLSHFGPTNLRSTIAFSLVKLAKPKPGDVVIDPMCGVSSIPIEGTLSHPTSFYLGGDIIQAAASRSRGNINNLTEQKRKSLNIDTVRWDVTALPLRDQSVDVVVCDLPFGKRCGSKADNRVLYFKALVELARVTRVETGIGVFLTHDKRTMTKNLLRVQSLWKNFSFRTVNIGGLVGGIYLLQRTGVLSDSSVKPLACPNGKCEEDQSNLEGKEDL